MTEIKSWIIGGSNARAIGSKGDITFAYAYAFVKIDDKIFKEATKVLPENSTRGRGDYYDKNFWDAEFQSFKKIARRILNSVNE